MRAEGTVPYNERTSDTTCLPQQLHAQPGDGMPPSIKSRSPSLQANHQLSPTPGDPGVGPKPYTQTSIPQLASAAIEKSRSKKSTAHLNAKALERQNHKAPTPHTQKLCQQVNLNPKFTRPPQPRKLTASMRQELQISNS